MMYMIGMQAEEGIGYGDHRPDPISLDEVKRVARQEALQAIEEDRHRQILAKYSVQDLSQLWNTD